MRKVAVVGSAQTKFVRKAVNKDYREMIHDTVELALESTGLKIGDIETIIGAGCDMQDGRSISSVFAVEAMGGFLKEESKIEADGIFAAVYAYQRILSGIFDTAMVVGYSKGSECSPAQFTGTMFDPFYSRPVGLDGLTAAALQARRYMAVSGATEEQAAKVAVKNRANGKNNPYAQIGEDITVEDVLKSEVIASPIKKLDAPPISDGACVLILAAEGRAEKICPKPAWIKGVGYIMGNYYLGYSDMAELASVRQSAEMAYRAAGIKNPAKEIGVAEIYESTTFGELMLYEALGFCGKGGGGALIDSGRTQMGGSLPVNPSGGTLCANAMIASGMVRLAEAAMQVGGAAGARQVAGVKTALAHGYNGNAFQHNAVFVLGN